MTSSPRTGPTHPRSVSNECFCHHQGAAAVHLERRSDIVGFDELQRMLRLEGELSELPPGSEVQRHHALDGLMSLVGAQVGLSLRVDRLQDGSPVLCDVLDRGFESDEERGFLRRHVADQARDFPDPSLIPLSQAVKAPVSTFLRSQLVDDRTWYSSPHVQELRRGGRVDSFIYTLRLDDDRAGSCDSISLHRGWGRRPFGERERRLVDLFYRESRSLKTGAAEAARLTVRLPRRLRQTLDGIKRGLSEKEIASDLGLSHHTVHDYLKELHRRFGARSRGDLLARVIGKQP